MNKRIIVNLSILVLSGCLAGRVEGKEILTNSGFEEPVGKYDKAGWDVRGPQGISLKQVKDPVVEGRYALLVAGRGEAKWEGLKQVLKLQPGKTYRLSGAIRLGPGEKPDRGAVQLIKDFKDGSKDYEDIFRGELRADEYVTFSEEFTVYEENIVEMTLSIHGMEGGRSFIVDNFSLKQVD
jgi:hypothetical protein